MIVDALGASGGAIAPPRPNYTSRSAQRRVGP